MTKRRTVFGPVARASMITRMRVQAWRDRRRLRQLQALHPGLDIDATASSALAVATFDLYPGANVRIGARVATERRPDGLRIMVRTGGTLVVEEDTWLRSDLGPVILCVYEGATLHVGRDGFLNGCTISAKAGVHLDPGCWVGPGARIWDSDQHALDADRPEAPLPVVLGRRVWIASDATVLKGVTIGEQSVVGTRALVTKSLPPHVLALGSPAVVRGAIGDRLSVSV